MHKPLLIILVGLLNIWTLNEATSKPTSVCSTLSTDSIKIGMDGKLVNGDVSAEYSVDLSEFNQQQKENKRELLEDISLRLKTTIDSLEKHRLVFNLLIDVDSLKERYSNARAEIINVLGRDSLPNTFAFVMKDMTVLSTTLNEVLKKGVSIKNDTLKGFRELKIYKPLYANQFYRIYYKKVFEDSPNSIYSQLREATYESLIQSFKKDVESLDGYIKDNNDVLARRTAADLQNHTLFKLFFGQWLPDLLWINKGVPNLNPFDASSLVASQLNKFKKTDSIYLRYLQSQVDRKLLSDSSGNYNAFRLLLEEWRKYDSGERSKTIKDSLINIQKSKFESIKTDIAFVNKVRIPVNKEAGTTTRELLASNVISDDEDFSDLGFLPARQKKMRWLIHNVKEDQKIVIHLAQKKSLDAQGKWEKQIGEVIGQAADVYSLFNPYSAFFENLQPSKTPALVLDKKLPSILNEKAKSENQLKNLEASGHKSQNSEQILALRARIGSLERLIQQSLASLTPEETNKIATNYLEILVNSSLPPKPWGSKMEPKPAMQTKVLNKEITDSLLQYHYKIQAVSKKDTAVLDAVKIKRGKYTFFNLSAGISYTFGNLAVQHLSKDAEGRTSFNSTSQDYSALAAVNFYPLGMLSPDDHFISKERTWSRGFLQFGVGIPKPLENFFFGVGYNFGPGLMLSGGLHLYSQKNYDIRNDIVVSERRVYSPSSYISLGIDPALFVKALGLFGGGDK